MKLSSNNFEFPIINKHVCDLGFILCTTLHSHHHIVIICCKALKILGLIKRISINFNLSISFKVLYCVSVHSTLEYGSVVWDLSASIYNQQIERVQCKFLKYAAFNLKINCPPYDWLSTCPSTSWLKYLS